MQPCDTKDNSEIGGSESDGAFHDPMKEAGNDTWMKYRHRGEKLLQGMLGTAAQTAQSIWQGDLRQNLKRWYWFHAMPSDDAECDFSVEDRKFASAFKELQIDTRPASRGGPNQYHEVLHQDNKKKDNQGIVPCHRQKYSVDEKEYQATGAYYKFGINQSDGVIFALYLCNPRTSIEEDALISNKTESPKLHFFSDILWGCWSHDEKKVKNIRYFIQLSITNTETLSLISRALKSTNQQNDHWPGVHFLTSTPEGAGLLASPNGASFAYFLMQHKTDLGPKTIIKITVFLAGKGGDETNLVFHVHDAPRL